MYRLSLALLLAGVGAAEAQNCVTYPAMPGMPVNTTCSDGSSALSWPQVGGGWNTSITRPPAPLEPPPPLVMPPYTPPGADYDPLAKWLKP